MKTITKLWIGLIILIILTPIGLVLPAVFKAETAWGEWGIEEIKKLVGYIPQGFERLASLWKAPMQDYEIKALGGKSLFGASIAYIISSVIGLLIIVGIIFLLGKIFSKKDET